MSGGGVPEEGRASILWSWSYGQAVVSCLTSVLGPELLFSNRAVSPPDC